ncbi:gpJ [Ruegeria sp. R11]|nr:gpJ [Ruegeria sp. R11]
MEFADMTRFAALDLAALPQPEILQGQGYDAILAARLNELEARAAEDLGPEAAAQVMATARNVAASPLRALNEAAAARELYADNRMIEAIRSVYLALASGPALDQLGAERGVVRKVLDGSDPDSPVYEGDGPFRARIQLAVEAWSPFGGEGAYIFWALQADDRVVDVAVYGPNDNIDPPIPPAEPKLVVLSSEDGGVASEGLLSVVRGACVQDKRRPVGDLLSVVSARPVPFHVEAILHVEALNSSSAVEVAARDALQGYLQGRLRIGRTVYLSSLAAALSVPGVVDVEVIAPSANIEAGPFDAPHCGGVSISLSEAADGWRNV